MKNDYRVGLLLKQTFTIHDMYRVSVVESNFEITNMLGCDSLVVDFVDLSSVTSDVLWKFGDGNSSILNNPQHTYFNEGIYDITLYSTSLDGCKDTLEKHQYIHFKKSEIDVLVSDSAICRYNDVFFLDSSTGIGLNYLWDLKAS